MLCVRSDRRLDALTLAVLRDVNVVAHDLQFPYFVVGAMARDILLEGVFGIDIGGGTRDVDLAVAVKDWTQFAIIKERLVETGKFRVAADQAHKLHYHARQGMQGYPLDIIPFRGAEQPGNVLIWPREEKEMNVVGYEETLAASALVQVEAGLQVHVASLPGLALLKVFAWADRGQTNSKDARDLAILLRNYAAAGNEDRLYGDELGILNAVDHEWDLAGARLLRHDVRRIAAHATCRQMLELLGDPARADRLVSHMAATMRGVDDNVERATRLLDQFRAGLADT
jgi:predicted nucleotidyltransferase